ncbi:MAG TPA: hypothetical protein VF657_03950 [Actinoplanes sp.]|jgi:hypothetical protein
MRFGLPVLTVTTSVLVVAGGFTLATATTGIGTSGPRPVAFAVPAEQLRAEQLRAEQLRAGAPAMADPAARAVLRTRSDARPASWWINPSGPGAAAR